MAAAPAFTRETLRLPESPVFLLQQAQDALQQGVGQRGERSGGRLGAQGRLVRRGGHGKVLGCAVSATSACSSLNSAVADRQPAAHFVPPLMLRRS